MSVWGPNRRGARPVDMTWMTEDVALAPDWLQEEIARESEDLRQWLGGQVSVMEKVVETGDGALRFSHMG